MQAAAVVTAQAPAASQHAPPQGLLGVHDEASPWKTPVHPFGAVLAHEPAAQQAPTVGETMLIE